MKQITRSFAVVLSFALILASLPPSALADGMAVGKTGVPLQPIVALPVNLNPGGVNMATMPGDLVSQKSILQEISVLPTFQPNQTPEGTVLATQDSDKVVTTEIEALGAKVQTGVLPEIKTKTSVNSKTWRGWVRNVIGQLRGGKVNWDNAAQRPEFSELPTASIYYKETVAELQALTGMRRDGLSKSVSAQE